ncbi:MAG: hypothetical protein IJ257_05935 [Treponema sp.]|nr:hypothetical protein [Treponema sp.]
MKKLLKTMVAAYAALALFGTFVSCSNDGDDESDPYAVKPAGTQEGGGKTGGNQTSGDTVTSFDENGIGNIITFMINADSTGTSNKITLKYMRSAKSAKEKITLTGAEYLVQHNSGTIVKKTGDLVFSLNNYGSCFEEGFEEGKPVTDEMRKASGKYKDGSTELKDPATDACEYQCELSYAESLKTGDTVKFQLVKGGFTIEEGATATKDDIMPKIKAILIDADEKVGWYKEIFAYEKDFSKENGGYPKVVKSDAKIDDGVKADHGLLESDFNTMAWGTAVKIPAEKFANAAAGDKIILTYKMNEDGDAGYHMFQLWNLPVAEENTSFDEIKDLSTDGTYTHVLKAAEVADLKANGLAIQGNSVTITKVVFEKGDGTVPEEPETPVDEDAIIIELPQNFYDGENHGLSFRKKIADLGIEFFPVEGETYTIYMEGKASDYTHLSNMCIGFETDYDWQNCAMEGGKDFTGLQNGVSVDVTFNGTADGDWYFWFYDGDTDATAEPVTLTLSEFSVTKK